MTVAPRASASWTTSPPVTPPAPCTSTHSPAGVGAASVSAWSAVSAGTGNAAAVSQGTAASFGATSAAGATSNCAHVPWCRSGTGCVSTSSPNAKLVTASPTSATTPTASTPSASGGFWPTFHSPRRTISSEFPIPAARTVVDARGTGRRRRSARVRRWPPRRRMLRSSPSAAPLPRLRARRCPHDRLLQSTG
jgi:hypothetical protein